MRALLHRAAGSAHPLLLALRNLIDNALHHTPKGTAVCIQRGTDSGQPWLQVCDDGAVRDGESTTRSPATERLDLGR